jgi:hypothetical protein
MATQLIDDAPPADDAGDTNDNAPAQLNEVEQLASEMGWAPKDKFTGPEGKWKPAKDFILKGKEISDGLRDTVKDLKRTVEHMAATGAKMTERALKEQAKEIEARFAEAVENKDARGAAKAAQDMEDLKATAAKPSTGNPERDFAEKNPWYGSNRKATALAVMVSNEEAAKGADIPSQLAAVEKAVRDEFPELFEGGAKTAPKPAEVHQPAARSTSTTRAKGYADMPADVKKAAEGYVTMFVNKMGDKADPDKIRAQYAKDYWAEQA